MYICSNNNCWFTNIGEAFIDLGNDLNLILLKEIGNAEIVKSNKGYFEN